MRILSAIVEPTADLVPLGSDADLVHRRRIRPKPVGDDAARSPVFLHDLLVSSIEAFGDIALYSSNLKAARQHYNAALRLYQKVENSAGEANCIGSLGDVAFELSDYAEARSRFESARQLYKDADDVAGEASCLERLRLVTSPFNNAITTRRAGSMRRRCRSTSGPAE